jgi:hypothetical protein
MSYEKIEALITEHLYDILRSGNYRFQQSALLSRGDPAPERRFQGNPAAPHPIPSGSGRLLRAQNQPCRS